MEDLLTSGLPLQGFLLETRDEEIPVPFVALPEGKDGEYQNDPRVRPVRPCSKGSSNKFDDPVFNNFVLLP